MSRGLLGAHDADDAMFSRTCFMCVIGFVALAFVPAAFDSAACARHLFATARALGHACLSARDVAIFLARMSHATKRNARA